MIVTFYSYKGGTGRTMALANVAWILAGNGLRVLAVDWDLASPGLHRYFHPFLGDKNLRSSPGVIDMVRDYATAVLEQQADPFGCGDALRYAASLDWRFPGGGGLDLLPAGRQHAGYAAAVNTFDWTTFFEVLDGEAFLKALAGNLRAAYDVVLIDSRPGLSDVAGVCTIVLPDTVVCCFTLNQQSIEGAASVTRSIVRQRDTAPLRVLPTPMRVEDGEQVKLEAGREHARMAFRDALSHLGTEERDRYWGEVEVPYRPYYAYEEILAAFGDRPGSEASLLAAYERLAAIITDGRVDRLTPMREQDRRRWLAEFERSR